MKEQKFQWRFGAVILAALLLVLVRPVIAYFMGDPWSFQLLFSMLIVAVIVLLLDNRSHRRTAITLGVFALLFLWLGHVMTGKVGVAIFLIGTGTNIAFLGFALYSILQTVLFSRTTSNALSGAVCGYLLLGIIWGDTYIAVEMVAPGSFSVNSLFSEAMQSPQDNPGVFEYYSFVTLTTLGYGDITPVGEMARNLSWIEAMTGQLYLAIIIAGLVGRIIAEKRIEAMRE